MQVVGKHCRVLGIVACAFASSATFAALASPGGTLVVTDEPTDPDLAIQDFRIDNTDATHVPIKVRLVVPARFADEGKGLRWAKLTAYLTKTTNADDVPLTETTVKLGTQWSNRSIVIEVPSPGAGRYFVHVKGELSLYDRSLVNLETTSTQEIRFGDPKDCAQVDEVVLSGIGACPVLFATKSSTVLPSGAPGLQATNRRILDSVVAEIDGLCTRDELHRVSVRGWASPLNSVNPTNEELAQLRSKHVWHELRSRVSGCEDLVYDDSGPGLQAVTTQFGAGDSPNQCVQIKVTRHSCKRLSR